MRELVSRSDSLQSSNQKSLLAVLLSKDTRMADMPHEAGHERSLMPCVDHLSGRPRPLDLGQLLENDGDGVILSSILDFFVQR